MQHNGFVTFKLKIWKKYTKKNLDKNRQELFTRSTVSTNAMKFLFLGGEEIKIGLPFDKLELAIEFIENLT